MENRGGMAFPELHSRSAGCNKNMNQYMFKVGIVGFSIYIFDQPAKHSDQRPFQWDRDWMILFNVKISWG